MLKLTIAQMFDRIKRQFGSNLYDEINVDTKKTWEKTNFEYCLVPNLDDIENLVEAPNDEEDIERTIIIKKSEKMFEYFCYDLMTRRASFVNNYDGEENHCISYFHFYVRDNMFSMNVYVRSMNFDTNFVFDNQTFMLAYFKLYELLKARYKNIEIGYIKVNTFSMHKIIDKYEA